MVKTDRLGLNEPGHDLERYTFVTVFLNGVEDKMLFSGGEFFGNPAQGMVEGVDHGFTEKGFLQDLSQFLLVLVNYFGYWQTVMVGDNFSAMSKTFLVVGEKKQFVPGMKGDEIGHSGVGCNGAKAAPDKELDQKVLTEDPVAEPLLVFDCLVAELLKDQGAEDTAASLQELGLGDAVIDLGVLQGTGGRFRFENRSVKVSHILGQVAGRLLQGFGDRPRLCRLPYLYPVLLQTETDGRAGYSQSGLYFRADINKVNMVSQDVNKPGVKLLSIVAAGSKTETATDKYFWSGKLVFHADSS